MHVVLSVHKELFYQPNQVLSIFHGAAVSYLLLHQPFNIKGPALHVLIYLTLFACNLYGNALSIYFQQFEYIGFECYGTNSICLGPKSLQKTLALLACLSFLFVLRLTS